MHQALKRKGVTLQLLWAEYVAVHGEHRYRYSQYCNRYRLWRDRQNRSLRQVHLAGDKLFIDYCGPTVPIADPHTGQIREAWLCPASGLRCRQILPVLWVAGGDLSICCRHSCLQSSGS